MKNLFLIFLFFLFFSDSLAEEYTIDTIDNTATIEMPNDWGAIPIHWIDSSNEQILQNNVGRTLDGGFYLKKYKEYPFVFPFITYYIQYEPNYFEGKTIQSTLEDIANKLLSLYEDGEVRKYKVFNRRVNVTLSESETPYIDYDRKFIMLKTDMNTSESGMATNLSVIIPFKGGFLNIMFYSLEEDYPVNSLIFDKMISSIKIFDEARFPQIIDSKLKAYEGLGEEEDTSLDNLSDRTVTYIIVIVLISLIIWYFYWRIKTSKSNSSNR